jgi:tetratricopeptide (TPR) repeat protein
MPDEPQTNEAVKVFYSYSHKDERLRDTLDEHLSLLERQGVISEWHDRGIGAGREWAGEIDEHLKSADIILLLISASFIASDYCYDIELKLAMERHEAGSAVVIPIILRPCDWEKSPFSKLNALPKNAKPVTKWTNRDDAFKDIAHGIRLVAEELKAKRRAATGARQATTTSKVTSNVAASPTLRPPVVGFVARRDKEGRDIVELLTEELSPDKNQLVALWGPGGVGKTTLAAEVVRETEEVFNGRLVWASSLQRADFSFSTLLDEIATQLDREDLRKLAPEPKAAQVAALVSEAPTLIILDNFETVTEEEQARCIDFLARGVVCPALITTRAFVNRDDVYNIALAAMSMDEARDFLGRLVKRTRTPSNFDRLDRDALIYRCEANPLVLQWVVKQIDLAKRPQDVLDDLTHGEGDAAERVFARSYNLPQLGDDGRAALLSLSLFTPTASREALAEVSGFGDMRRLDKAVENLSSLWLVETTEGNERLFLRGLTRELAKSRLSKDSYADNFRQRYVAYFRQQAVAHLDVTLENLDALEVEKDNLLCSIDTASELKDWESTMKIRASLDNFLVTRGYWDEAIKSGEKAEAIARDTNNQGGISLFTMCVALIHSSRGEYEEAKTILRGALESLRKAENESTTALCLVRLGNIALEQRNFEEAGQFFDESLMIYKKLNKDSGISSTLHNLAVMARMQNELEDAQRLHNESLELKKRLGDLNGVAYTLHELGNLAFMQGKLEETRRLYAESLELMKRLGNQYGVANVLFNLGLLTAFEGNKTEAAQIFLEALRIFENLGSPGAGQTRKALADLGDETS